MLLLPSSKQRRRPGQGKSTTRRVGRILFWTICILMMIGVLGFASYRFFFAAQAWWNNRLYEGGYLKLPTIDVVETNKGLLAHAITFYGDDGDAIFIEEMRRSYLITGGIARIEIPDSQWFDINPEGVDAANITFTPILITQNNNNLPLPALSFTVEVPYSPLKLINPTTPTKKVNTSLFPLKLQIVPGSIVYVGGKDVTGFVDVNGEVSVNTNVYAQGDNVISVLVKTANHKETRQDIILNRPYQEIALEYSVNTPTKSSQNTMTISGQIEPGAALVVDTPHVDDSISLDMEKGTFSFVASFDTIGDNVVSFRATKDGKKDSVIAMSVYYLPPISQYSRKAWKMDYTGLVKTLTQWNGRIFLCDGVIEDVIASDPQIVMMDVGTDGNKQLVALENLSSIGTPSVGLKYRSYADVSGQYYYNNHYYPMLTARYMSDYPAE